MGNHVNDWEQEVMTSPFVKMGNHVNDSEKEVMTSSTFVKMCRR